MLLHHSAEEHERPHSESIDSVHAALALSSRLVNVEDKEVYAHGVCAVKAE